MKSTCLWLLAKLEKRRNEYGNKPGESDYSYRAAQAIIAEIAGFNDRSKWADEMKANGYEVYP